MLPFLSDWGLPVLLRYSGKAGELRQAGEHLYGLGIKHPGL